MKYRDLQGATIKVERQGHILLMGLNNPQRYNRFSLYMYHELSLAYGLLDSDPELRCGAIIGRRQRRRAILFPQSPCSGTRQSLRLRLTSAPHRFGFLPLQQKRPDRSIRPLCLHPAIPAQCRRSITVATPCPMPMHMVARPYLPSFWFSTWASAPVMRAPEQPSG